MADTTTKVTLVANVAPYVRDVTRASTATDKLGRDIDQAGNKTSAFNTKMGAAKGALVALAAGAGALAATGLVRFLTDSVRAAGDLEQSVGGVDAVFKDGADAIHDFGQNSADAVGLSRNEFNELATVTGALLKNSGIEDFSQATLDLTTRAADVSATFGGTAKDAVEAFNAALRGESDPIERYGIKLNEAAVNAKVLEMGLGGLEGAQAEQAKVQARIQLIMEQSADSAGRFAAEVDTLQGQQQRLNAEWENAKASLGEAFLPAVTDAVRLMRQGLDAGLALGAAFEKIPGPVLAAAAALAAVHVAGGPLRTMGAGVASVMADARLALRYAGEAAERAGGGFKGAYVGLSTFTGGATTAAGAMRGLRAAGSSLLGLFGGPWGLAFIGAAALVTEFMQSQAEARAEVEEFRASLDQQTGAITENTRQLVAQKLEQDGHLAYYQSIGGDVNDLTAAILGEGDARDRVVALLQEQTHWQDTTTGGYQRQDKAAADLQGVLGGLNDSYNESVSSLQRIDEAAGGASEEIIATADAGLEAGFALGEYGAELDETAESTEEVLGVTVALAEALGRVIDQALSARDAESAYEASLDALTETLEENGAAHGFATAEGRANEDALTDLAGRAREAAQANLENGDSLSNVKDRMSEARGAFIEGATQMGYTKNEARRMADQVGLTTNEIDRMNAEISSTEGKSVTVEALGMGASIGLIDDMQGEIASTKGKTVTVSETGAAAAAGRVAGLRYQIGLLGDKNVNVTTYYRRVGDARTALADGGPVVGPGGPRDDLVPIMGSNGEHMLTAAEVAAAGGHGEIYRLRKALLAGRAKYDVGGEIGAPYMARAAAAQWSMPAPSYAPATAAAPSTGPTYDHSIHIGTVVNPQSEPATRTAQRQAQRHSMRGRG